MNINKVKEFVDKRNKYFELIRDTENYIDGINPYYDLYRKYVDICFGIFQSSYMMDDELGKKVREIINS